MTFLKIKIYTISFLICLFFFPSICFVYPSEKTLYEKTAHAPLVILGITTSDDTKYAEIEIQEVLKGQFQGQMLNISFRRENFERKRGQEKIVFSEGEEAILFLEPVRNRNGRIKDHSLFKLIGGTEGKIEVSPESGQSLVIAIKRLIEIQSIKSMKKIWKEHKNLLQEKNRFLIQAGFQEIIKFRIADWILIPTLLQFLSGKDVEFRICSVKVMAQILEDEGEKTKEREEKEEVIRSLINRARGDDEPMVRVEAIRALNAAGAEDYLDILETISENDESQVVRYEAQKVIYEIRMSKKSQ